MHIAKILFIASLFVSSVGWGMEAWRGGDEQIDWDQWRVDAVEPDVSHVFRVKWEWERQSVDSSSYGSFEGREESDEDRIARLVPEDLDRDRMINLYREYSRLYFIQPRIGSSWQPRGLAEGFVRQQDARVLTFGFTGRDDVIKQDLIKRVEEFIEVFNQETAESMGKLGTAFYSAMNTRIRAVRNGWEPAGWVPAEERFVDLCARVLLENSPPQPRHSFVSPSPQPFHSRQQQAVRGLSSSGWNIGDDDESISSGQQQRRPVVLHGGLRSVFQLPAPVTVNIGGSHDDISRVLENLNKNGQYLSFQYGCNYQVDERYFFPQQANSLEVEWINVTGQRRYIDVLTREFEFAYQDEERFSDDLEEINSPRKVQMRPKAAAALATLGASLAAVGVWASLTPAAVPSEELFVEEIKDIKAPGLSVERFDAVLKKVNTKVNRFFASVDTKLLDVVTRLRVAKAASSVQPEVVAALEKELAAFKPEAKLLKKIESYETLRRELRSLKRPKVSKAA